MKLTMKVKLALLLAPIHVACLALAYWLFADQPVFFILTQLGVIGSYLLCLRLFGRISEPIHKMLAGIAAIKDQDFNVKFVPTGQREVDQLVLVYNSMIDHLRQERVRQQEQHFFLDKLIQTSPIGVVILDYDERIVLVNPRGRDLLGLPDPPAAQPTGKMLDELDHPVARFIASLQPGEARVLARQGATFKCRKAQFIDQGFARPFILIEELTTEILRAEKQAFGKVIRMMAHEVNNTLGAINALLHALLHYADKLPPTDTTEFSEAIGVSIERNERLTRFMRNFADVVRLPAPQRERYPLPKLVQHTALLMDALAAQRGITLSAILPAHHQLWAYLDVQQLEQVLTNAVKNALEAGAPQGEVQLVLEENPLAIVVRDNGSGIPPELEDSLFTPFFTTKETGQGIGLTLSREILLNHGFGVSLRTLPNGWTEFRINFT